MSTEKKRQRKPRPAPFAQLPGAVRLREIREIMPELWLTLEQAVGASNVANHARGTAIPTAYAAAVYEHHADIPVRNWLRPEQLTQARLPPVVPGQRHDDREPGVEASGGGE